MLAAVLLSVSAQLFRLGVYLVVPAASFAGSMVIVGVVAPAVSRRLGARGVTAGLLVAVVLGIAGVLTGRLAGVTRPVGVVGTVYVVAALAPLAGRDERVTALLPAVAAVGALGATLPVWGSPEPLLSVVPPLGLSPLVGLEVERPDGRPELPALVGVLGFAGGMAATAWPAVIEQSVSGLAVTVWSFLALGIAAACGPLVAAGAALADR